MQPFGRAVLVRPRTHCTGVHAGGHALQLPARHKVPPGQPGLCTLVPWKRGQVASHVEQWSSRCCRVHCINHGEPYSAGCAAAPHGWPPLQALAWHQRAQAGPERLSCGACALRAHMPAHSACMAVLPSGASRMGTADRPVCGLCAGVAEAEDEEAQDQEEAEGQPVQELRGAGRIRGRIHFCCSVLWLYIPCAKNPFLLCTNFKL